MKFADKFGLFLAPTAFQGIVSLAMLPMTTYILGPKDYGLYALVAAIAGVGSSLGTAGVTQLLSAHLSNSDTAARKRLLSSVLFMSLSLVVAFGGLTMLSWTWMASSVEAFVEVPTTAVCLALVAMIFSIPWSIASVVIVLDGRARSFARTVFLSTIANSVAVLFCLYELDLHALSLFVGSVTSSVVLMIGGFLALREDIALSLHRPWVSRTLRLMALSLPTGTLETVQTVTERTLLAQGPGMSVLGLYNHAQQYRSMVFMPVKAVSNAVWPITLEEARSVEKAFINTSIVWDAVYFGITLLGVFFATVGSEAIGLLTHGKFSAAAPITSLLMLFMLVQLSGKPQVGLLYALDQGEYLLKLMGVSAGAGIGLLLLLVPHLGVYGALVALFAQQLLFRAGIQLKARKLGSTPFRDHWAIGGGIVVMLAIGGSEVLSLGFGGRCALLLSIAAIVCLAGRRLIGTVTTKLLADLGGERIKS